MLRPLQYNECEFADDVPVEAQISALYWARLNICEGDLGFALRQLFNAFRSSGFYANLHTREHNGISVKNKWELQFTAGRGPLLYMWALADSSKHHPLQHLRIKPSHLDPTRMVEIYDLNIYLGSCTVTDSRGSLKSLLEFCWRRGNKILADEKTATCRQEKVHLLPPLARTTLGAVSGDESDLTCPSVHEATQMFERKDLAQGLMSLFAAFQGLTPQLRYLEQGLSDWEIYFRVGDFTLSADQGIDPTSDSPFCTLLIRPCSETAIHILAFNHRVRTFEIFGSSKGTRAMVEYIWEYGNACLEDKISQQQSICLTCHLLHGDVADTGGRGKTPPG